MKMLAAALALTAATQAPAQAPGQTPRKPSLIVAIAVDQFSSDLFTRYRGSFSGGLKRLSGGVAFARGYQSHAASETCPGHSTILTGAHPSRSGIIANNWMNLSAAREDKRIYCAEDERVAGSNSRTYTVSPYHLKVPALGDRMKAANPSVRVVTVAGKDRAAVMMGGHAPDQRWWWVKDRFVTHAGVVPPPITGQVNASIADALSRARPALALSPLCAPKNKAVAVGDFTVGTHRFARAAADSSAFTGSPELDAATLTMAAALTQQLQLGRGGRTDLLAIGLSATDYVGHRYGTDGVEMCLQLQSLDADLASFFTVLDRTGIDYAVVLTADHGGNDLPERDGPPSARALEALDPSALSAAIGAELGLTGPIIRGDGPGGDMYIDRSDRAHNASIQAAVKRRLANHPQVESVLSWAELRAMPVPTGSAASWTPAQRARASFDPDRSGDLVMLLKSEITPIPNPSPGYVATHGSPWDYDRQVPILFWWKGVRAAERGESARTVDILPTLATLIGLPVPEFEIDGRALSLGTR